MTQERNAKVFVHLCPFQSRKMAAASEFVLVSSCRSDFRRKADYDGSGSLDKFEYVTAATLDSTFFPAKLETFRIFREVLQC